MEGVLALVGLVVLGVVVVAPIVAIIAFSKARGLEARVRNMQADLEVLETRVSALLKTALAERGRAGPEPAATVSAPPAAAPSVSRAPAAPAVPAMAASAPAVPPPAPAVAPAAPPAPPAGATRPMAPAMAPATPARPPAAAAPPPRPPRPPSPPPPPAPSFDWEGLLGLKGAAWLGGITIVIAGIFLAKMAYDAGYFVPELRVAAMLAFGIGGLVWAEVSLRRGYATTANAVSGAAIAILYIAFYAARAVWHLLPLGPTFFMMVLVTIVAGLVAIRYDAMFSAVLGLLGGFATPILLSTGEDRPLSLFSYILLLNVGLMAVALKKRWHGLVVMGLAGTFLIEVGWFGKFMSPEKTVIGLLVFLLFGLLYLLLPSLVGEEDSPTLVQAGAAGAAVPFVFALILAGNRSYAGEWPLLFGYLALLNVALVAVGLLRGRVFLVLGGAAATALTLPLWAGQSLAPASPWGPTLAAIGLTLLLNAPARLAGWLAPERLEEGRAGLEAAGIVSASGLALYTLVLVARTPAEPPWTFVVLLAALTGFFLERTGEERVRGVAAVGPVALAILVQIWFHHGTQGETLLRNLSVPLLFTITLALVAARRSLAPVDADEDGAGVVGAVVVAIFGLLGCLSSSELGGDPKPLFAALWLNVVLLIASALRRDWTWLVPLGLLASAFYATVWQELYFHPAEDVLVVVPVYALFYLAFLALPFLLAATIAPTWRDRPLPWLSSALAGPAFFLPLYRAVALGWGKAYIGALPVLLAAISVAALAGVSGRFSMAPDSTPAGRRRLNYLALFSAIALGFIALAIPLQLDRQWITVAWALEAAAVWWLFGKLPHPGLKYFGMALYGFVGVRLLLNWDNVLRYQERGLPVFNWLLYTYGIPALCCLAGAAFLKRAEAARRGAPEADVLPGDRTRLAPAASFLGLILFFVLINLEIVDYYSTSRYVELNMQRQFARDLTMSVAWGIYAMLLLVIGLWREVRALRIISLGFLLLTVAKVFLYDLSNLVGVYRILSFLGLGVALILVSLLYQRFVLTKERSS